MIAITATAGWRTAHAGAAIGVLEVSGADNTGNSPALNERKRKVEARLRETYRGYARKDFIALPVMAAYQAYYRRFEKTYHVQLQLESIVLKQKSLPDVSPLVDANFIAEVETLVLTAGHDADRLHAPVVIDVSQADDQMTPMNGAARLIRAGDMVMRDRDGVSCSIIYGQDNRSPISPATSSALYIAYAPPGVPADSVQSQLNGIWENIRLFAPQARLEQNMLIRA